MVEQMMDLKETESMMRALAKAIEMLVNPTDAREYGFALVIFKFNEPGVSNYISNAVRDDMITALRETADRIEKREVIPPVVGEA